MEYVTQKNGNIDLSFLTGGALNDTKFNMVYGKDVS